VEHEGTAFKVLIEIISGGVRSILSWADRRHRWPRAIRRACPWERKKGLNCCETACCMLSIIAFCMPFIIAS
jgi:hypothetical protein